MNRKQATLAVSLTAIAFLVVGLVFAFRTQQHAREFAIPNDPAKYSHRHLGSIDGTVVQATLTACDETRYEEHAVYVKCNYHAANGTHGYVVFAPKERGNLGAVGILKGGHLGDTPSSQCDKRCRYLMYDSRIGLVGVPILPSAIHREP